jgi:hypothetical protein
MAPHNPLSHTAFHRILKKLTLSYRLSELQFRSYSATYTTTPSLDVLQLGLQAHWAQRVVCKSDPENDYGNSRN